MKRILFLASMLVLLAAACNSQPTAQQNTQTSNPPAEKQAVQTPPPQTTPTPTPPNENTTSKTYTNSEFGFQLTLTEAWKNYKVFSHQGSQGVGAPTYLDFAIPTSDKTKCVINVTDEVCGYAAPFTITIIAKDRNVSTMDGKLGEDKTNTYYYSTYTHFNELPSDLSSINFEIKKVISTFKFTGQTLKKEGLNNGPYTPIEKLNLGTAYPGAIKVGLETKIAFRVPPDNYLPRTAYIELEQFDETTSSYKSLGKLNDNGLYGDLIAEDGMYALEIPLKPYKLGYLKFRYKALGNSGYFYSEPFKIEVSPADIIIGSKGGSGKIINDPELGKIFANEVTITTKEGVPAARVQEIVKDVNGTITTWLPEGNLWGISLPPSNDTTNIKEAIKKLKTYPEVESAEANTVSSFD